jgi:hypothetical protein
VDYSLFIMVMIAEMLEKVEIPPTVAPVEFPLQSLVFSSLFWCFGVSAALSSRIPEGPFS